MLMAFIHSGQVCHIPRNQARSAGTKESGEWPSSGREQGNPPSRSEIELVSNGSPRLVEVAVSPTRQANPNQTLGFKGETEG